jgi:lysophospholipase L1-like esterase
MKKLNLSIVSLVLCGLLIEVFLRLFVPLPKPFQHEPYLPWIDYSPTLGWVNKPDYQGRQTLAGVCDVAIAINSKGLRDREYAYERTPGRERILVLGDSFTFGHGVEESQTYAAVLEDLLGGAEVLNSGVVGTGHDQQLLWLEEEGFKYKPDRVIWGFSSSDIPRNSVTFRRLADPRTSLDYAKPRFVIIDGKLVLKNVPTPKPDEIEGIVAKLQAEEPKSRSRLIRLISDFARDSRERQEQMALTKAITEKLIADCRDAGTPLLIVYLPVEKWLTQNNPLVALKRRMADNLVRKICAAENVPLLDLTSAFQQAGPEKTHSYFIPTDGHYSPAGHRLVAGEIAGWIRTEGELKP